MQLKKRWDLIPNLVEVVKRFALHEKVALQGIISARDGRKSPAERFAAEGQIEQDVHRLVALSESYPQLQSDAHFMNLQRNLTEIESQISASRRAYNAAVTEWNGAIESFPGNLLAQVFHFRPAPWFEIKAGEREARPIDLG